jgi:hypothetical protein
MIRIAKGDITLECETQADLRLALGVFADVDKPVLPAVHLPIEVNAEPIGRAYLGDQLPEDAPKPWAEVGEQAKLKLVSSAPQHIPVRAKQLDVLEAVLLFPEGVPAKGVSQLLGLTDKAVGQRMQSLKRDGLVELVPHHNLWRATTLARRAKLVRA